MARKLVKLADKRHPLYDDNESLWELYLDSVKGSTYFISEVNLFSHRLEDTDDYDERLERAYFLNFCESIPKLYNTYIFKERIERPVDENLILFRNNVDGRNTDITSFIRKCGFLSSVLGTMHVLVDITPSPKKKITRADAKILQPYCTLVYPTQLKDWSVDRNGNFRWVVIESTYYDDIDPSLDRNIETHYMLITQDEWRIEDKEGKNVTFSDGSPSSGKNNLGIVPLATLYHEDLDDNKVGESMLKDIVYINRTIMNWCSCIDEQVERQTFSQLIVPDDGTMAEAEEKGADPLNRLGTSSIWTFPSDANHPPNFISPDTANIQVIWDLVIDHIKEIYRLAGLLGTSSDMYIGRSGRSAQMGFVGVNAALADKAKAYQKFENDISRLAYMQLGLDPTEFKDVRYADSFDIAALSEEIDSNFRILERNFSETLNKKIMKNVARKAVPLAPEVLMKQIEDEIDAGTGIVEPISSKPRKPIDDGSGNPNVNDRNTFQSKATTDDIDKKKEKIDKKGL